MDTVIVQEQISELLAKEQERNEVYTLPLKSLETFESDMREASDRARIIMAGAWIDNFLEARLRNDFAWGSKKCRDRLFLPGGAFGSLGTKLSAARCAGLLDTDVHHDLEILRKMRNDFAHDLDTRDLDSEKMYKLVNSLQVPKRKYIDWGHLRASATRDGVVLFTADRPEDATKDLRIPGTLTFGLAIYIVVYVTIANLKVLFHDDDGETLVILKLPDYMNITPES